MREHGRYTTPNCDARAYLYATAKMTGFEAKELMLLDTIRMTANKNSLSIVACIPWNYAQADLVDGKLH